jgi:hypothetical protein
MYSWAMRVVPIDSLGLLKTNTRVGRPLSERSQRIRCSNPGVERSHKWAESHGCRDSGTRAPPAGLAASFAALHVVLSAGGVMV